MSNVVIYGRPGNGANGFLAEGLEALGHRVKWREDRAAYKKQYYEKEFDLAITAGLRPPMTLMRDEYNANGRRVIISDLAFLRTDLGHLQLSIDNINWLPDFDCPPDRFYSLGFDIEPKRRGGDPIIICGQKGYDAQHLMSHEKLTGMYQWWVDQIREHTDRPIIYRPHPLSHDMRLKGVEHDIPTDKKAGGLRELFEKAHCVVAYNSTSLTEAMLWGIPVFCHESAQVAHISNGLDFSKIEKPFFPTKKQRLQHFSRVAYAQWLGSEMQSGEAVEFYLNAISQGSEKAA